MTISWTLPAYGENQTPKRNSEIPFIEQVCLLVALNLSPSNGVFYSEKSELFGMWMKVYHAMGSNRLKREYTVYLAVGALRLRIQRTYSGLVSKIRNK